MPSSELRLSDFLLKKKTMIWSVARFFLLWVLECSVLCVIYCHPVVLPVVPAATDWNLNLIPDKVGNNSRGVETNHTGLSSRQSPQYIDTYGGTEAQSKVNKLHFVEGAPSLRKGFNNKCTKEVNVVSLWRGLFNSNWFIIKRFPRENNYRIFFPQILQLWLRYGKKSRIRETKHLSTDADSSTDTTEGWTKNIRKPNFFEKVKKSSKTQKLKNV